MTTLTTNLANVLEMAVARLDAAEEHLETGEPNLSEAESLAVGVLARIEFERAQTAAAGALLRLTQAVAKVDPTEGWRQWAELYREAGCPGVRPLHRAVLSELDDRETIDALLEAVREADAHDECARIGGDDSLRAAA